MSKLKGICCNMWKTNVEVINEQQDSEFLAAIRAAVNSGLVLGGERFKDQIEAVLSRSVRAGKPGRPKKRRSDPDAPENKQHFEG